MRKILLFSALICILPTCPEAAASSDPAGGRSAGLGNASVTLVDPGAAFHNPAALAFLPSFSVFLAAERRFWMEGLDLQSLSLSLPSDIGSFAISAQRFGWSVYSEQRISLAYARSIGQKFSLGMQFDYLGLRIAEYGRGLAFTADVGLLCEPMENLLIGTHLYNPFRAALSDHEEVEIPVIYTVGFSYRFSEELLIAFELEKSGDQDLSLQTGIEYAPKNLLQLRAGLSTAPVSGHFGLGINTGRFDIDVAVSAHQILGFTPTLGLSYTIPARSADQ